MSIKSDYALKTIFSDDDVVDQRDPQELAGFCQPIGDVSVGLADLQAPARMIMRHNNTGGTVSNSISEDFSWMYQAGGQRADGYHPLSDQAVRPVESQTDEMFLLLVTNIR